MEIEASELRIGNWIRCNEYSPMAKKEFQCQEIFKDSVTIRGHKFLNIYIEPIPLTEEWLLKFGFEKNEYDTWVKQYEIERIYDHYFYISVDMDGDKVFNVDASRKEKHPDAFYETIYLPIINYVHQLQNLFHSLTCQELTYKP